MVGGCASRSDSLSSHELHTLFAPATVFHDGKRWTRAKDMRYRFTYALSHAGRPMEGLAMQTTVFVGVGERQDGHWSAHEHADAARASTASLEAFPMPACRALPMQKCLVIYYLRYQHMQRT